MSRTLAQVVTGTATIAVPAWPSARPPKVPNKQYESAQNHAKLRVA